jgi:hypothetical protein
MEKRSLKLPIATEHVKKVKVIKAKTKGRFDTGNTVKTNNSFFIKEKLLNT